MWDNFASDFYICEDFVLIFICFDSLVIVFCINENVQAG